MAGLVPAIHVFREGGSRDVDARDKPGHDDSERSGRYLLPGSEITPWCTSLFQMNSTISAPIVAMMNPAP
jgi:hypothetical protein